MQKGLERAPVASRGSDTTTGANAIAAVAAWCKAMQNGSPIIQGLRHVADAFMLGHRQITEPFFDDGGKA